MAELHGRVFGFPDRETVATPASAPNRELRASVGLAFVVALLATAVAHAQPDAVASSALVEVGPAVSVTELERLAGELRSEDASVREHAFERLGHLPASALPAITERVRYLARLVIPPEDGEEALQRFRHATGSRRADDMIDVAPGILAVLAEDRSADVGRSAERVLLIRSLEQIRHPRRMAHDGGRLRARPRCGAGSCAARWCARAAPDARADPRAKPP
ncbi:MAG: hypothetical protein R3B99_24225 [Polyangiales bacterium]